MRPVAALVTFRDVTLGYDRHPAVHHLNGVVEAGALLAVIGPNGAGKSTLLRGIAGVLKPLSGVIDLDGLEPGSYTPLRAHEPVPDLVCPPQLEKKKICYQLRSK